MIKEDKLMFPISEYTINDFNEDDRFQKFTVAIAHVGQNLNYSSFTRESLEELAKTLPYAPVVGYVEESSEGDDFRGHERELIITKDNEIIEKYLGVPFGFLPKEPNARFEVRDDGKEWLVADGYLWTKFDTAINIFKNSDGVKGQSMEIQDITGHVDDDGIYVIESSRLSALCVLGDDVQPAMDGSTIETFSITKTDSFQELAEQMINEYTIAKGDVGVEKDKLEETFDEEVVESEVEEKAEMEEETATNEEVSETKTDEVKQEETEETPETEDESTEEVEESDEEVEEDEKAEESADNSADEVVEEQDETYSKEYVEELESEIATLKEKLNTYMRVEKEAILEDSKDKISEESFEKLVEEIDNYDVESFEKEVAYIVYKEYKPEEEKQSFTRSVDFSKSSKTHKETEKYGNLAVYFKEK